MTDATADLTGKVAVVTGGSRDIGAAPVRRFARAGTDVVIVLRAYLATDPTIKTPEWYLRMLPVGRWGEPSEMGWLAAFLCSETSGLHPRGDPP